MPGFTLKLLLGSTVTVLCTFALVVLVNHLLLRGTLGFALVLVSSLLFPLIPSLVGPIHLPALLMPLSQTGNWKCLWVGC